MRSLVNQKSYLWVGLVDPGLFKVELVEFLAKVRKQYYSCLTNKKLLKNPAHGWVLNINFTVNQKRGFSSAASKFLIESMISCLASSTPPQPSVLTHLPFSKSL